MDRMDYSRLGRSAISQEYRLVLTQRIAWIGFGFQSAWALGDFLTTSAAAAAENILFALLFLAALLLARARHGFAARCLTFLVCNVVVLEGALLLDRASG